MPLFMVGQTDDALYTLDTSTGIATKVADITGDTSPEGIAWDGSNLYLSGDTTNALFTLDRETGVATRVNATNALGETLPGDMAWDGSKLYLVGFQQKALMEVDRTTGIATKIGSATAFGVSESLYGLAWDGNKLFGTAHDKLYEINRTTGVATKIGSATAFGVSETQARGLAWDGSKLFMVGRSADALYEVNRTTGVATRIGSATEFGVMIAGRFAVTGERLASGLEWVPEVEPDPDPVADVIGTQQQFKGFNSQTTFWDFSFRGRQPSPGVAGPFKIVRRNVEMLQQSIISQNLVKDVLQLESGQTFFFPRYRQEGLQIGWEIFTHDPNTTPTTEGENVFTITGFQITGDRQIIMAVPANLE